VWALTAFRMGSRRNRDRKERGSLGAVVSLNGNGVVEGRDHEGGREAGVRSAVSGKGKENDAWVVSLRVEGPHLRSRWGRWPHGWR
jgi:hypothetical protein